MPLSYGKAARFNYVRGQKQKAAKNGLSPPELFFQPQADLCLRGWRQINWLINYPGKLEAVLGLVGAPHIYSSRISLCASEIAEMFLWLRHEKTLAHLLVYLYISVVPSWHSFQVSFLTPYLVGTRRKKLAFSLHCFAWFQNCQRNSSEIQHFLLWVSWQVHAFISNYSILQSY